MHESTDELIQDPAAWADFHESLRRGAGICDRPDREAAEGAKPISRRDFEYQQTLVRRHRNDIIPFLLERCGLRGQSVLEIGAGTGGLAVAMIQAGVSSVTAIEPVRSNYEAGVLRVRAHGAEDRVRFHHVAGTSRLPFPDGVFDACVCNSVLQYVADPARRRALLQEMHRVVRPGGIVAIAGSGNGIFPGGPHSSRAWSNLFPRCAGARGHARGVSYWEIRRALAPLGAAPVAAAGAHDRALDRFRRRVTSRWPTGARGLAARLALACAALCEATLCRLLRVPLEAFLPYPEVAFRKGLSAEGPTRAA